MSIQAVLFDRDGVLTRFQLSPVVALLANLGLPFEELKLDWDRWSMQSRLTNQEEENQFIQEFWSHVANKFHLSMETLRELRAFDYRTMLVAHDDARSTMQRFRDKRLRVGVLSNFPLASLAASLESVGLRDLVDVVCAAPKIGARKPAPEAYNAALSALQVEPSECAFVDDELMCVEGAERVGLHAYLLDRKGEHSRDKTRVVRSLSEFTHEVFRHL